MEIVAAGGQFIPTASKNPNADRTNPIIELMIKSFFMPKNFFPETTLALKTGRIKRASTRKAPKSFIASATTRAIIKTIIFLCNPTFTPREMAISELKKMVTMFLKFKII